MSIFVWNGSYCPIWNHILKKQNALKWTFTHFPIIKNAIKRKTIQKCVRSIYNFFCLFYMPTFLRNFSLMPPLSYLLFTLKDLLSWEFIILIIRMFNLKKNSYVQTIRQKNCRCKLNVFLALMLLLALWSSISSYKTRELQLCCYSCMRSDL